MRPIAIALIGFLVSTACQSRQAEREPTESARIALRQGESVHDSQGGASLIVKPLEEKPAVLGREMIYCRFPLVDGAGNSPTLLRAAVETTQRLVEQQVTTLVACGAGMSRSPAVVAMVLSRMSRRSPDECLAEIVAGQPHDVSPLFWGALKQAAAGMPGVAARG